MVLVPVVQVVETDGVAVAVVGTSVWAVVLMVEVLWPHPSGFENDQTQEKDLVDQTTSVSEQVDLTTSWDVVNGQ